MAVTTLSKLSPSERYVRRYRMMRASEARVGILLDRAWDGFINLALVVVTIISGACLALLVGAIRERVVFGAEYADYLRVLVAPWWPVSGLWDATDGYLYVAVVLTGGGVGGHIAYLITFSYSGHCDHAGPPRGRLMPALFLAFLTAGILIALPLWHQPVAPGLTVNAFGEALPWGFWSWLMYGATWWLPGLFVLLALLRVGTGLRLFPRSRWERRIWQ